MTMAGGAEEDEDALFAELSVKAGRFLLADKLKQAIVPYLVTELGLKTLSDVESLGAKGFEQAVDEATASVKMPAPLKSGALEWFAHLGDDPVLRVRVAKEKTPNKKAGYSSKAKKTYIDPETDDDDDNVSVCSNFVGGLGADKQAKDEEKMKLTGDEIQALHRSVYKGRVVSSVECEGVPYGQDCQFTEWARQLRKTGVVSYLKLLEDKDSVKAKDHLVTLIREYNEKGYTQEVTILTSAMTSSEEMFIGDEKGLCNYQLAHWKYYQGRAYPKEIDLRLVVKSLKLGYSQNLQKQVASLEDEVKKVGALNSKVENLQSKLNSFEQKMTSINNRLSNLREVGGPSGGGAAGAGSKNKCSYCQESGHFWRNCPARLRDLAKEADGGEDEEPEEASKGKKK